MRIILSKKFLIGLCIFLLSFAGYSYYWNKRAQALESIIKTHLQSLPDKTPKNYNFHFKKNTYSWKNFPFNPIVQVQADGGLYYTYDPFPAIGSGWIEQAFYSVESHIFNPNKIKIYHSGCPSLHIYLKDTTVTIYGLQLDLDLDSPKDFTLKLGEIIFNNYRFASLTINKKNDSYHIVGDRLTRSYWVQESKSVEAMHFKIVCDLLDLSFQGDFPEITLPFDLKTFISSLKDVQFDIKDFNLLFKAQRNTEQARPLKIMDLNFKGHGSFSIDQDLQPKFHLELTKTPELSQMIDYIKVEQYLSAQDLERLKDINFKVPLDIQQNKGVFSINKIPLKNLNILQ